MVKLLKIYACTGAGSSVLCICKKWSKNQDKPRNYIQERPTLIYAYYVLYMWEERKQTQCPHRSWRERTTTLIWSIWKYNSNIFFFHPLVLFPEKMMRCPWILCFDLLPLQYTDLTHEIWRFLVYISLDISVQRQSCI